MRARRQLSHPYRTTMLRFALNIAVAAGLSLTASGVVAAPVNKCVVNGAVTYQQDPCPSDQVRKPPDIQELNAAEKKRRAAAAAPAGAASTASTAARPPAKIAPSGAAAPRSFSCDGRQYCSQMRSCAEANYFLANCPGVKMDGDKNGIPCEQQWCARP